MPYTLDPSDRRPIADPFRRTADAAVRWCVRRRVSPNAVSLASVAAAAVGAALILAGGRHRWVLLVAPLPLYLRLWFNMLDGMVAIAARTASATGELFNELPDRASDVLVFAAIATCGLAHPASGYWAAILAVLTAYVRAVGRGVGGGQHFGGWMSKPNRMVAVHAGCWLALVWHGTLLRLTALDWTCVAVVVGGAQTVVVRLTRIVATLRGTPDGAPGVHPGLLPDAPPDGSTSHTFLSHDGAELFYRAWVPARPTSQAVVLLHRGHEHSGRWAGTVAAMNLAGVAVFAPDQRGHGRSPGVRGFAPGGLHAVVRDVDAFARHLVETRGVRLDRTVVIAHSVGGVVATAWVHDYAPPVAGLALVTPAFRVRLYVPLAVPFLRLKRALFGGGVVKSYVRSKLLTHDPAEQAAYDADPLVFRQISVDLLLDLHDAGTRLVADAGAIRTPVLVLAAGRDYVVDVAAQRRFVAGLSSPVKSLVVADGQFHALLHDTGRAAAVGRLRRFVGDCLSALPADDTPLLSADVTGYTWAEYHRLAGPSPLPWRATAAAMRAVCGPLSRGFQLGYKTGFDSGLTLDYVYANRPAGIPPVGWVVDWFYLNSLGWRGIRARGRHLQDLIRGVAAELHAAGRPVRLLDVAAGGGRYVLEAMRAMPDVPTTALLRDFVPANLAVARHAAESMGLGRAVTTAEGDAFDRASLAAVTPRPTVAVVSGLYELFPGNDPVRASLAGLADAVEPGGYLIYTGQPWHPQVEFIARTLTNHRGRPWVMRRRTQAEMDALVRTAGFEKVDQRIDPWGIFTVSVARRTGAVPSAATTEAA